MSWRWVSWLLFASPLACGPELEIRTYQIEITLIERCTQRGGGAATCEDLAAQSDRVPAWLEIDADQQAVLFVTDPDAGGERGYSGSLRGQHLSLHRQEDRVDEASGCRLERRWSLDLDLQGERLTGGERRVSLEDAACNAQGFETLRRSDLRWDGVDDAG